MENTGVSTSLKLYRTQIYKLEDKIIAIQKHLTIFVKTLFVL